MTSFALLSQEISETSRLCVCSCRLPHPTTPCAVSIAGWSWYNGTCFKHALKLPSLFPSVCAQLSWNRKGEGPLLQAAALLTNHRAVPTLLVSFPLSFFNSLPLSLGDQPKRKKSAGKKSDKQQAASGFCFQSHSCWIGVSVYVCAWGVHCPATLAAHCSSVCPRQRAKHSRGGRTQG